MPHQVKTSSGLAIIGAIFLAAVLFVIWAGKQIAAIPKVSAPEFSFISIPGSSQLAQGRGGTESLTGNQAPTILLTTNATSGPIPFTVNFNASGSSDPNGNIVSYSWNFGDGTTGTGAVVSHTYTTMGTYTVLLTITDNNGASVANGDGRGGGGLAITAVAAGAQAVSPPGDSDPPPSAQGEPPPVDDPIPPPEPPPVDYSGATQFFVSPTGTAAGAGTLASPWDLQTALAGGKGNIGPGDTIWLRGGAPGATYIGPVYVGISGTPGNPITIRNYNRERATFDARGLVGGRDGSPVSFSIGNHSYLRFWGLEFMDSLKASVTKEPHSAFGDGDTVGNSYINMIVHDGGIGLGGGIEAYGNIMYYNGKNHREHAIYWQNLGSHMMVIKDNIILNPQGGYGIQLYTQQGNLRNILVEGNTLTGSPNSNIIVGGGAPVDDVIIRNNYVYDANNGARSLGIQVGYSDVTNEDVSILNNYVAGSWAVKIDEPFKAVTMKSNILVSYENPPVSLSGASRFEIFTSASNDINYNSYYTKAANLVSYTSTVRTLSEWRSEGAGFGIFDTNSSVSSGNPPDAIFVRPNQYESGRANITIFNWSKLGSVSVNASQLSGILRPGDSYELHSAQDYYGDVITDTYSGGPLSISMTGRSVATPTWGSTAASTFPEFGAFVIMKTSGNGGSLPSYFVQPPPPQILPQPEPPIVPLPTPTPPVPTPTPTRTPIIPLPVQNPLQLPVSNFIQKTSTPFTKSSKSALSPRQLQQRLNTLGFLVSATGPGSPGKETNSLGIRTIDALKRFQRAHRLPETGTLTPQTLSILVPSKSTNPYRQVTDDFVEDSTATSSDETSLKIGFLGRLRILLQRFVTGVQEKVFRGASKIMSPQGVIE